MAFEDLDFEEEFEGEEEEILPEEAGNRTFYIIAAVIGVIAVLALVCIVVVYLSLRSGTAAQTAQQATLDAQNTEVAAIVAEKATEAERQAIIAAYTATATETPIPSPTFTPTATTPVVAESPTSAIATPSPGTATLDPGHAMATLMQATVIIGTLTAQAAPTEIGPYGFADEVGLPAMLGLAALLIVVIFLARRLRTVS